MSEVRDAMQDTIRDLQEQADVASEARIKGDPTALMTYNALVGAISKIKDAIIEHEQKLARDAKEEIEKACQEDLNLYYWEDQVISAVQEVRDDAADDAISSVTYYLESECEWTEDKIDHYRDVIEDMVNDYVNMHLRDAIDSNVL